MSETLKNGENSDTGSEVLEVATNSRAGAGGIDFFSSIVQHVILQDRYKIFMITSVSTILKLICLNINSDFKMMANYPFISLLSNKIKQKLMIIITKR